MSTYNPDEHEGRTPDSPRNRPASYTRDDFSMEGQERETPGSARPHETSQVSTSESDRAATGAGAAAMEAGRDLASAAKDMGRELASTAREEGRSLVEAQKNRLAEKVAHVGDALQEAAQKLEEEGDANIAHYASAMAGHLHRAGDYIERRDPAEFFADAESFAHRRPELVFGAMFLAGLSLARFFKASGMRAKETHRDEEMAGAGEGRRYARAPYSSAPGVSPDHSEAGEWRTRPASVFTAEEL